MKFSPSLTLAAALACASLTADIARPVNQVTQSQSCCGSAVYQRLNPHFAVQITDSSCSAASITMIVNALSPKGHYTEQELLKAVDIPAWTQAVQEGGDGISLDLFSEYLGMTLEKFEIPYADIRTIHCDTSDTQSKAAFRQVLYTLHSKLANTFVFVNVDDFFLLPVDLHMGHICPVGDYDPATDQVLLMDVDKELESIPGWKNAPYWVRLDDLFAAMNTRDTTSYRGYVVLTLYPRQP